MKGLEVWHAQSWKADTLLGVRVVKGEDQASNVKLWGDHSFQSWPYYRFGPLVIKCHSCGLQKVVGNSYSFLSHDVPWCVCFVAFCFNLSSLRSC